MQADRGVLRGAALSRTALGAAFAALQAGRFAEALSVPLPDAPEAWLLRGLALAGCGDEGAAPLLVKVAAARPGHAHPLADLAKLLAAHGRDAAPHFRAVIRLAPGDARARAELSRYLLAAGCGSAAAGEAEAALVLQPGWPVALNLRGAALASLGEGEAAIACFRAAVARDPAHAAGWSNLGKALAAEGDFDAGLGALDRACRLRPQDAQLALNRAVALLKAGRFAEGWAAFEARRAMPGHVVPPPALRLPAPLPADLAGRTVLLSHEEGFGDTLQFLRYARPLSARGARVVAQVPAPLARITARVAGIDAVVAEPPAFDFHTPFPSLPRSFATRLETIPADIPYLSSEPDDAALWRERLAGLPGRRIGLVWAGASRPGNPAAEATDRLRSLKLARLAPLAAIPGVSWVSLQMGAAARESPPAGLQLFDPMPEVRDFADTAAVIANLDAVVTVDTSVAHLAGGMGCRVILLDRYDNCWRWLHGRAGSPWYPSLRILRQPRFGDWDGVLASLMDTL